MRQNSCFIKHTIWDKVLRDFGGRGAVCGEFWIFGGWGRTSNGGWPYEDELIRRLALRGRTQMPVGLTTSSASWAYGFLGGGGRERKEKDEMT